MKEFRTGVYCATGEPRRLWHDCKRYRRLDSKTPQSEREERVEIDLVEETEDTLDFVCPYCGFSYSLDKSLNLDAIGGGIHERVLQEPEEPKTRGWFSKMFGLRK